MRDLTQLSERDLLIRYHRHGEQAARDALIERFLPLTRHLARRYRRAGEPIDDLVQIASLGLLKAIERFDVRRATAFTSYAVPTIVGELKRYFRDSGWAAHVPRGLQERALAVEAAVDKLSRALGRSPSPGEVAEAMQLGEEEVLEAMEAGVAFGAVSLDEPRSASGEESESHRDRLGAEEAGYELVEYAAAIEPALRGLPERDRIALHLRFVEDMTQSEIAKRLGISQMHVSRRIRRALALLREAAGETEAAGPGPE